MTVKELNESSFSEAIQSNKVVIVDFFAHWCGPCKTLSPILEEVSNEGFSVFSVDVDENRDLSQKFSVSSIPTVLFFKNGKKVDSFVGVREKEDIIDMANSHN
jgi:thioredoxin 1